MPNGLTLLVVGNYTNTALVVKSTFVVFTKFNYAQNFNIFNQKYYLHSNHFDWCNFS